MFLRRTIVVRQLPLHRPSCVKTRFVNRNSTKVQLRESNHPGWIHATRKLENDRENVRFMRRLFDALNVPSKFKPPNYITNNLSCTNVFA